MVGAGIISSTNWTHEEVEAYLRHLSEKSFRNRVPVILYLSTIGIVGFVGNILVFFVYWLKFKPSASRVFVIAMAICDFITNTVGIPLQIVTARYAYDIDDYWLCRGFIAYANISTQASGFLLVLVALDRFNRICRPFKTQLTPRQSLILTVVMVVLAIVIFGPFVPYYGIHRVNTTEPGIQARMCWTEDEFKDTVYPIAFKHTVAVTFFLSLTTMVTCYIMIGVKLLRHRVKTGSGRIRRQGQKAEGGSATTDTEHTTSNTPSSAKRHDGGVDIAPEPSTLEAYCNTQRETNSTPFSDSEENVVSNGSENASSEDSEHQLGQHLSLPGIPMNGTQPGFMQVPDGDVSVQSEDEPASEEPTPSTTRAYPQRGKLPNEAHSKWQFISGLFRNKKATASFNRRRMQFRTTLMMFVLTLFYIVNFLPHLIMRETRSDPSNLCDNFTDCSSHNAYAILKRSFYINSAVNAFVYGFCNSVFRQKCWEVLKAVFRRS